MLFDRPARWRGAGHCASDNTTQEDVMRKLIISLAASAVIQASDQLGIPCERLMDSTWFGPCRRSPDGAQE